MYSHQYNNNADNEEDALGIRTAESYGAYLEQVRRDSLMLGLAMSGLVTPETSPVLSRRASRNQHRVQPQPQPQPRQGSPYSLITNEENDAVQAYDLVQCLDRINTIKSIQSFGELLGVGSARITPQSHCNTQNSNWEPYNNSNIHTPLKCTTRSRPDNNNLLLSLMAPDTRTCTSSNHNKRFSLGISLDDIQNIVETSSAVPTDIRTNPLHCDINITNSYVDATNAPSATPLRRRTSVSFDPALDAVPVQVQVAAPTGTGNDEDDTKDVVNPLDSNAPYFDPTFAENYQVKLKSLVTLMEQTSRSRRGLQEAKRDIAVVARATGDLSTIAEGVEGQAHGQVEAQGQSSTSSSSRHQKKRCKKKKKNMKQVPVQRRRSSTVSSSMKYSLSNNSLGGFGAQSMMMNSIMRRDSLGYGAHRRSLSLKFFTPEIFGW